MVGKITNGDPKQVNVTKVFRCDPAPQSSRRYFYGCRSGKPHGLPPILSRISSREYGGSVGAQFRSAPDHARTPDHAGGFRARAPHHAEGRQVVVIPRDRRHRSDGRITIYVNPDVGKRPRIR